jgi:uncharacterized phage protein (TIGR01671 family)
MRKFKFRAWNINRKRWETGLGLYFNDSKIGDFSECFHNQEDENDYVIQQFTGLIDKNGVEVYEGDILERVGGSGSFCKIVVSWHERECCFVYNSVSNLYGSPNPLHDNFVNLADWTYWVVCGNIFENPELLK